MARNLQDLIDYGILTNRPMYSDRERQAAQIRLIAAYPHTFASCIMNVTEQYPKLDLTMSDDAEWFNHNVWAQFLNIVDAGEATS